MMSTNASATNFDPPTDTSASIKGDNSNATEKTATRKSGAAITRNKRARCDQFMEKIGKRLVAEFLGTFLLTFVGVCVGCSGSTTADSGPVAGGLTVALIVMTIGYISGSHINPCVSIAFAIIGELKPLLCFLYIIAQIVGSTVAGIIARVILLPKSYIGGKGGMVLIPSSSGVGQAIAAEIVATFFLVFVVLHTAADQEAYILAPVAIGFVVTVNSYALGGISGCCMNPARSLGASIAAIESGLERVLLNSTESVKGSPKQADNQYDNSVLSKSWMDNLWYLIGTLLGTALAVLFFRLITAKNPKYSVNNCDCGRKQPPTQNEIQFNATPGGYSDGD